MKRHFITVLVVLAAGCMTQMAARKSEKQGPRIDVTADDDPAVKDADIWLDNEPKGRAPNAIATTTGRHLVELKKPGRVTFAQWVTVKSVEETVVVAPRLVALGNAPGVLHVIPNHWKYETTSSDGPPATRTVWEGGAGDFNGAQVVFLESVSITRDGTSRVDERDYYKKTGDGLYRLGVRGDTQSSDMHAISDTTFEAPQKVLPVPFQIGTSWSADTRHTLVTKTEINTRQLTGRATSTITGELAVSGREQVTVPAGVFECLVVRSKMVNRIVEREGALAGNVTSVTTNGVAWYAPRIGLVKSESTSEVESIAKGASTKQRRTVTMRLKQYRVERASFEMEAIGFVRDLEPAPPPAATPPPTTDPAATDPDPAPPTPSTPPTP